MNDEIKTNKTTTSYRLKQYMKEYSLKQVDILEKCKPYCEKYNEKISKSHLSQWVSGANEPNQRKVAILAMALQVQEAWLMGYDVPMVKTEIEEINLGVTLAKVAKNVLLEEAVKKLIKLQPNDQEMVVNLINSLYEKVTRQG